MFLTPRSSANTLRFDITTNGLSGQQRLETAQLPIGEWTHVAVSIGGDVGKLYVNGALVQTNATTINPPMLTPVNNYIGRSAFAGDPYFRGRVDGFRVYNRALTDFEVVTLAIPNLDNDADGFLDTAETDADTDNDGNANHLDSDSDNDDLQDMSETFADSDNDGIPNAWDADSDNDSMFDGWEFANGLDALNGGDAVGDLDGDGASNAGEYIAGTSPNDANDLLSQTVGVGDTTAVTIAGKAGRTYTLLRAESATAPPEEWVVVATFGPLVFNHVVILVDPTPPHETAYYRTSVTVP
jgi:hypothetical protein